MKYIQNVQGENLLTRMMLIVLALALLTVGIQHFSGANLQGTDFYIYYQAQRALFFDRTNPYSDQVAETAQIAVYKDLAGPKEDQLGYAYPPFSLLAHLPTLGMRFPRAQAFWMACNLIALTLSVYAAYPRAPRRVFLFVVFAFPFSFALLLGNYVILLFAILFASYDLLTRKTQASKGVSVLFGFLLSWTTVKPQFSWLFVGFFLLIALRKKQWGFIAGFFAGIAFMILSSFLMLPEWPNLWLERLANYRRYNHTWIMVTFLLKAVVPVQFATVLSVLILSACLGFTVWLLIQWWRGNCPNLLALAWCGTMIFLIHPRGCSYEQVVFLLPIIVWVCKQQNPNSFVSLFFGWGTFLVSWGVFLLGRALPDLATVSEWPLFFHLLWLGWLFYLHRDVFVKKGQALESILA